MSGQSSMLGRRRKRQVKEVVGPGLKVRRRSGNGRRKRRPQREQGCESFNPIQERDVEAHIRRYGGYNEQMINRFVWMGFDLDRVVSAFDYVGIDPNDGEDYELEEAYIGDITARLLGEP